jgi:hypothetical protein
MFAQNCVPHRKLVMAAMRTAGPDGTIPPPVPTASRSAAIRNEGGERSWARTPRQAAGSYSGIAAATTWRRCPARQSARA